MQLGSVSIRIIRREVQEEGDRIARQVRALRRRIDDAVRCRRQHMVGQPLQHVADIHYQRALRRVHIEPLAFARQQLQSRLPPRRAAA